MRAENVALGKLSICLCSGRITPSRREEAAMASTIESTMRCASIMRVFRSGFTWVPVHRSTTASNLRRRHAPEPPQRISTRSLAIVASRPSRRRVAKAVSPERQGVRSRPRKIRPERRTRARPRRRRYPRAFRHDIVARALANRHECQSELLRHGPPCRSRRRLAFRSIESYRGLPLAAACHEKRHCLIIRGVRPRRRAG